MKRASGNRPKQLSASFVRSVTRPGRYGDGRGGFGLSLLVKDTASGRLSKTWAQRIRIHGRLTNLGLGSWPIVTLKEARVKALANRRAVEQGRDPRGDGIPTFVEALEKVLSIHRPSWRDPRTEQKWRSSLSRYAFPRLGRKRVDKINTNDVLKVLLADDLWNTKRATARMIRHRIGAIMKWAVAKGYRADNPAGDAIAAALPKNGGRTRHHRALPHGDVPEALVRIREVDEYLGTRLAVEFLVLTAARSGEVRGARWSEIDVETATWTIPAHRMKTQRVFRIPLSARALKVLDEARSLSDDSGLVFPSVRGKILTDGVVSLLVRRLGLEGTIHGFRSSFRDWCGETGVAREVAEAALAHVVPGVEGAYARSSLFARRRDLMEAWAAYVSP